MLRPIDVEGLPSGLFNVDPACTFQPGTVMGLTAVGGDIVMTVCDGINIPPYGLADDVKTTSLIKPVVNERVVVIPHPSFIAQDSQGRYYITEPVSQNLRFSGVIPTGFRSDVACNLNPMNGVVTFPVGTLLNNSVTQSGTLDSILAIVSYTYEVAGVPGDDTTRGSGKVTVWNRRGEYITDQFDVQCNYLLNAPLYVCNGKLTTTAPCDTAPVVGMVTGPPSSLHATLQILWF